MNNDQFRKLVSSNPNSNNASSKPRTSGAGGAMPALGTRKSAFVPMTPRNVHGTPGGGGVDFARQMRERNADNQPSKKFKSYVPRGVKLGAGYVDRAKAREEGTAEADEKVERVKALEEQMKLGQISTETFEALRDKITGGDAASSHLVKGLDRKLLERVRRGEDVLGLGNGAGGKQEELGEASPDVDDALERLGEKDVGAIRKEKVEKKGFLAEKKGIMAPPPLAGKKRSRDEIMAELKAQRKAAADAQAAAEVPLGDRWHKVGDKSKRKIEIDSKGREVIITVDENGVTKKMVRKAPAVQSEPTKAALSVPDADKAVLGADAHIPAVPKPEAMKASADDEDDDDDDIFAGVGTDYNPLGNVADDDDDENSDSDNDEDDDAAKVGGDRQPQRKANVPRAKEEDDDDSDAEGDSPARSPAPATTKSDDQSSKPRNYFASRTSTTEDEPSETRDHLSGIQEVLKKAARMDPLRSASEPNDKDAEDPDESAEAREARLARAKKRAEMLANRDRDMEDIDMGFGGDMGGGEGGEEDGEDGSRIRLSEWKGGEAGWEEDDGKGGGAGKKKRKPKKRKGDASSMGDIMRVIEGRKGAEGK